MLAVHVMLDLLFVGYMALLVRMRNLAAEREMKLTFLPTGRPLGFRLIARRPRRAMAAPLATTTAPTSASRPATSRTGRAGG